MKTLRCAALITLLIAACGGSDPARDAATRVLPASDWAQACAELHAPFAGPIVWARDAYRAGGGEALRFHLKPAGLAQVLLHDDAGRYLSRSTAGEVQALPRAAEAALWQVRPTAAGLSLWAGEQALAVDGETGALQLADAPTAFALRATQACRKVAEAEPGASGPTFAGTNADGTVFGIADAHTHISAYQRLGGRVIVGAPFHPLGVEHALADCDEDHGPEGNADFIGNFVRDGAPVGSHATEGWPRFRDWPAHGTYTHQQTYYTWVQRAWMAGLRLLVNHTSGDEQLCLLAPLKAHGCNEMDQVKIQVEGMYALQDYIDAQHGGAGQGWFRIVDGPEQARAVITQGKLAVVLGIESSKLFDCGEFMGAPECTRADIDAGIEEFHALGIRSVFIAHWFDNAFGGAGLFDQSELTLNALNKPETGHYYAVEECPEPDMGANLQSAGVYLPDDNPVAGAINEAQRAAVPTYPPGPHCNAKGLTDLGVYVIEQLAARGMIIETDHLGAKMKNSVLDIVERLDYPVVAGHYHAGGISSPTQMRRILALGGIAAPIKPHARDLHARLRELRPLASAEHYFGLPMSTDSGGIASLPGPPKAEEPPVVYPFRSYDGQVLFEQQVSGERVFDYNTDGVAHYGLFADWLEAVRLAEGGEESLQALFRSAEAYLRMWERTGPR